MSVISMATTFMFGAWGLEQIGYDMVESSDPTGADALRIFGPPRWKVSLSAPDDQSLTQAADWEVLVMSLRRGVNCLAVWDPVRVAPRGTLRGTNTLNGAAALGATTAAITGASGTLLKGDWLELGVRGPGTSQLVKVMADMTAPGTVTFEPPLRAGLLTGVAVTWDHPCFYARTVNKSTKWNYKTGNVNVDGFALDLLETFFP